MSAQPEDGQGYVDERPSARVSFTLQDIAAAMLKVKLTPEDAEAVAVSALSFVAGDSELLPRFLALTGIEARAIRHAAAEPGFLAGVLQFILAHEPTLMAFCEHSGTAPETVGRALHLLPLGDTGYLASS